MSELNPNWAEQYRQFPRFSGENNLTAVYRSNAEDFRVIEQLGYEAEGSGEHQMLYIRKTGRNTADVADWLSKQAGIKQMDVGFSGLKDKIAVTEQWFSLYLPGKPDIQLPDEPGVEILERTRHNKKLRRGTHKQNQFIIVLRNCSGLASNWEARLESVEANGFPNYFGEQRFGFGFANLGRALAMFEGKIKRVKRSQKSMYLSAARSWLFNRVCAERLRDNNWDRIMNGEILMLEGSRSYFVSENPEQEALRISDMDIHTSGALWGRGVPDSVCKAVEWHKREQEIQQGLEKAGLKMERRALRALAHNLSWNWIDSGILEMKFELNNGCFATAVLREIADCTIGANK